MEALIHEIFLSSFNWEKTRKTDLGWILRYFTFRKMPGTHLISDFAQNGQFQAGNQEPENSRNSPNGKNYCWERATPCVDFQTTYVTHSTS